MPRLSGGERQRLALARALLRRPRFMLLDEATSALDLESERAILDGLQATKEDCAIVFITHRPATLALADRVVFMAEGRLQEEGTVEDLTSSEGRFFEMMGS